MIRRWLWLHDGNVRTDRSMANRGLYTGAPPATRRFVIPVVILGSVIALVVLASHDAGASSPMTEGLPAPVPSAAFDVRPQVLR